MGQNKSIVSRIYLRRRPRALVVAPLPPLPPPESRELCPIGRTITGTTRIGKYILPRNHIVAFLLFFVPSTTREKMNQWK